MNKLLESFGSLRTKKAIAILPDFFLDILIDLHYPYHEFLNKLNETYKRGGGNLLGTSINFLPGGNAGNVALTTNKLEMTTYFIGETSELGMEIINHFFKNQGINPIFTTKGDLSSSFILEFTSKETKTNVMASSSKSINYYGPEKLNENQIEVLKKTNFICITNFQNSRLLDLIDKIFDITKENQTISIDFSDLNPHKHRIKEIYNLFNKFHKREYIITGNENEIGLLADLIDKKQQNNLKSDNLDGFLISLSKTFPNIYFCLHTSYSSSIATKGIIITTSECINITNIKRVTGAGDSWHGGFITGLALKNKENLRDLSKIDWKEILSFANYVAGFWVANGYPGSITEIKNWTTN